MNVRRVSPARLQITPPSLLQPPGLVYVTSQAVESVKIVWLPSKDKRAVVIDFSINLVIFLQDHKLEVDTVLFYQIQSLIHSVRTGLWNISMMLHRVTNHEFMAELAISKLAVVVGTPAAEGTVRKPIAAAVTPAAPDARRGASPAGLGGRIEPDSADDRARVEEVLVLIGVRRSADVEGDLAHILSHGDAGRHKGVASHDIGFASDLSVPHVEGDTRVRVQGQPIDLEQGDLVQIGEIQMEGPLVQAGERQAVIDFLDLVAKFWATPGKLDEKVAGYSKQKARNREQLEQWKQDIQYDWTIIGLRREKDIESKRINARVKKMIEAGLVDEVKKLLAEEKPLSKQAHCAIGYAEIIAHLNGRTTLNEAVELIKKNTRRLAKGQRTWFKTFKNINWLDIQPDQSPEQILEKTRKLINNKK